jgi:BirA family biotin operon repressor/biotin-[acetyl-CoA-carboxylase] ligase
MGSDLSHSAIQSELTTRFVGRNLLYVPTVSSTMDIARQAAVDGAEEGTTIVAEEQTQGRARLGRAWINPQGVMAISVLLRPELSYLLRLTMVAALATSHGIEKSTRLRTTLKWPNDVLIRGKKVSGILTESALRSQSVDWAIVGIGVNVNFDPGLYPEIADIATSLSNELGHEVSHLRVLVNLLDHMESLYLAAQRGEPIHEEWRNRLDTLGKMVTVKSGSDLVEGRAESVEDDGSLLLRRPDGTLVKFITGEVSLR